MWSPLAVVGFLYRDSRYQSEATQIPDEAGLAQIPYTDRKFLPQRESNQHCIRAVVRVQSTTY